MKGLNMREFKIECTLNLKDQMYGLIDYTYQVDDTTVIFTQHSSGAIYHVDIILPERLNAFHLHTKFGDKCFGEYPTDIWLQMNFADCEMDEIMIKNLKYLYDLAKTIMNIFNVGQHKELFDKNFGEV
jgi:hypothetical protein